MASLTIDVELPPDVKITGYGRVQDGHGIEVSWPLPAQIAGPIILKCDRHHIAPRQNTIAEASVPVYPQMVRDRRGVALAARRPAARPGPLDRPADNCGPHAAPRAVVV